MGDWPLANILALVGTLGAATVSAVALIWVALVARRTGMAQIAKDLTVNAQTVQLSDRQFQARWEERLETFTKMQGDNYEKLLERVSAENARLVARVDALSAEVAEIPALRQALWDCEERDRLRDGQLTRMVVEIQRLGGNPAC